MALSDALGGIGAGIGSWIGYGQTQDDRDKIRGMDQGLYDQAGRTGTTAFSGISTDPTTRAAQMRAMGKMGDLANSNGMDPQAVAMQAQANRESAGFEQSQRQAIQQNMQARGMGGSGAEIAGLLSAQQGGANRAAATGQQAASDARNRAMQALGDYSNMAGNIHKQDYGEAADKARAQDEAQRFRFGAMSGAGDRLNGYYGNDMNMKIGQASALGRGIGSIAGAAGDVAAGAAGFSGGGGAPNQRALNNLSSWQDKSYADEWENPYK